MRWHTWPAMSEAEEDRLPSWSEIVQYFLSKILERFARTSKRHR